MSKWIDVKLTIIKSYAVEVEDNEGKDEAVEAVTNTTFDEWDDIESSDIGKAQVDRGVIENHYDKDKIINLTNG